MSTIGDLVPDARFRAFEFEFLLAGSAEKVRYRAVVGEPSKWARAAGRAVGVGAYPVFGHNAGDLRLTCQVTGQGLIEVKVHKRNEY